MQRCAWAQSNPQEIAYHDEEWGVPVKDDRLLFEMLTLEGAQAGLSWATILKKRAGYKAAFDDFNVELVARYDQAKVDSLLQNPEIVRHRQKIEATINNAQRFLEVQQSFGSFAAYIWTFVDGQPIHNSWQEPFEVPATSPESDAMSKDLKKRGFKFIGSTTCYAFMQGIGMVNDHLTGCFRYSQVKTL